MSKLTLATALFALCFASCNGPPPPTSPADEPPAPEPEVTEPEATEPEATEPEATEPEATEPEEGPAPEATADPDQPPPCPGLPKKRCQVTQGCAWSDKAGKGECIYHKE